MESGNEELKTYFNKLVKTIETQANLRLGDIFVVDKQRIDDILCCIDINFPVLLKKFRQHGTPDKNVRAFNLYDRLIKSIKINPLFIKSLYAVNYNDTVKLVKDIIEYVDADEAYIRKTYPELLT